MYTSMISLAAVFYINYSQIIKIKIIKMTIILILYLILIFYFILIIKELQCFLSCAV